MQKQTSPLKEILTRILFFPSLELCHEKYKRRVINRWQRKKYIDIYSPETIEYLSQIKLDELLNCLITHFNFYDALSKYQAFKNPLLYFDGTILPQTILETAQPFLNDIGCCFIIKHNIERTAQLKTHFKEKHYDFYGYDIHCCDISISMLFPFRCVPENSPSRIAPKVNKNIPFRTIHFSSGQSFHAPLDLSDLGDDIIYLNSYFKDDMDRFALNQFHEFGLDNFLSTLDLKGKHFIDVGANKGLYSVLAGLHPVNASIVHTFEPCPQFFKIHQLMCEYNSINIVANPLGVGAKDERMCYTKYSNYYHQSPEGNYQIDTTRLDTYFKKRHMAPKNIGFIKIDVDGPDMEALLSLGDYLDDKYHPPIAVEVSYVWQNFNYTIHKALNIMFAKNYKIAISNRARGNFFWCNKLTPLPTLTEKGITTLNMLCLPQTGQTSCL